MVQEGLEVAIGMAYKVLDSAAEIFVDTFYRELYRSGRSFWHSAQVARSALRVNDQRHTKFNTNVVVKDGITPVLVSGTIPEQTNKHSEFSPAPLSAYRRPVMDILGRERDILMLEMKLSKSNVLQLHGSPGCGKTLLVEHLCWWWKATRFIDGFVTVDCSTMHDFVVTDILSAIVTGIPPPDHIPEENLLDFLNQHRYLVVIDSLEAARSEDEAAKKEQRFLLRRFLRKSSEALFSLSHVRTRIG